MRPLPIDPYIERIVATVRSERRLVLIAPPGAGKTTRVPPAIAQTCGRVIVLQPRRIAARSLASRIADERGWTLGAEVGWHVRFEKRFAAESAVVICTEGIVTSLLKRDPLLSDFGAVILDEFHERTIHSDLALALLREAMRARDDLATLVMSATIDPHPVARFLGDDRGTAPVIEVPGRTWPIEVRYRPGSDPAAAVAEIDHEVEGDILVFQPGVREIEDTIGRLRGRTRRDLVPLHGSLPSEQQDAAIAPAAGRRVIVATNLAETSLTVEGVRAVVDSGLQKTLRYDPGTGIDRLVVERIARASAEQRAGRAGRVAAGLAVRLWDERDHLREEREPEIRRTDPASALLDVVAWGGDPAEFEWFERPGDEAFVAALDLLARLGLVIRLDGRLTLTDRGRSAQRLPLHPRLASLLADGGDRRLASIAALLSEGRISPPGNSTMSDSDLLLLADRGVSGNVARASAQIARLAPSRTNEASDVEIRKAIFRSYGDRVARRRESGDRYLLQTGSGAILSRDSSVRAEWIVAVDVAGDRAGGEALIRLASAVDPEWLSPTGFETRHQWDARSEKVRASVRAMYGALLLGEREADPDEERAREILRQVAGERPLAAEDQQVVLRARAAGVPFDRERIVEAMIAEPPRLRRVVAADLLTWEERRTIEKLAPSTVTVPSGRAVRLDYSESGDVLLRVKLQELFGLADTPVVGRERRPVTIELLSPAGRPVQRTTDLRSFWTNTYPEVRRDLRGRYPKHPWPDDPWSATPTARTKKRS